ncbi:GNAT family N-acetyltransferase [Paenibacillus terrigena]|uniref:GNAT family N-acetyltransferase n=1 Tax=Paenibacillus terrigena TaxID=369333 RepID=UPI000361CEAF|nr:GNAT family N-acetyltransferase [Paenibacillus terrigena]
MAAQIIQVKTEEELNKCLSIRLEVFVHEQQVPEDLEIDEYDTLAGKAYHVLLEHEGQAVATGRLTIYQDHMAKMQRIAVKKAYRGYGYGRVLLLALEQIAKDLGLSDAILDAQCQAEIFYAKLGYEVISQEPFYDAGILHVRMKKPL